MINQKRALTINAFLAGLSPEERVYVTRKLTAGSIVVARKLTTGSVVVVDTVQREDGLYIDDSDYGRGNSVYCDG